MASSGSSSSGKSLAWRTTHSTPSGSSLAFSDRAESRMMDPLARAWRRPGAARRARRRRGSPAGRRPRRGGSARRPRRARWPGAYPGRVRPVRRRGLSAECSCARPPTTRLMNRGSYEVWAPSTPRQATRDDWRSDGVGTAWLGEVVVEADPEGDPRAGRAARGRDPRRVDAEFAGMQPQVLDGAAPSRIGAGNGASCESR